MPSKKSGFTLIELLVVISIIGLLASVILVSLQSVKTRAKDLKLYIETKELIKALEIYKLENGVYPGVADTYYVSSQLNSPICAGGQGTLWTQVFDNTFTSKYTSKLQTEVQPCGLIYIRFSGNVYRDIGCSATAPAQGAVEVTYNKGYEYHISVLVSDPDKYTDLRATGWIPQGGNPSITTNQKCILGPSR